MKDDPPKESSKCIRKSIDTMTANFCAMKKKLGIQIKSNNSFQEKIIQNNLHQNTLNLKE